MRVMMIGQDLNDPNGLAARTARAVAQYGGDNLRVALAYVKNRENDTEGVYDGLACYPVTTQMSLGTVSEEWESTKGDLLRAIDDFKPDLIHCFGSEWIFGAIVRDVSIPVVIHMLGFLSVYFTSLEMVSRPAPVPMPVPPISEKNLLRNLKHRMLRNKRIEQIEPADKPVARTPEILSAIERDIMGANRYFMGRTKWDREIVKHYSPNSKYYHVDEVIKPTIYKAAGAWEYAERNRLQLLTVSSADDRKGNEIILRTAKLLKELLHLDFVWRVAGRTDFFQKFEEMTGICRQNVNVELIGMINDDRIIEEMKSADIFIHPSIVDNSPHAVCEAQLIGCPVIASYVGGVPDLITDGETGFLYPYNEPYTLAFLISDCFQMGEVIKRISRHETEMTIRRHDPERITKELYAAYQGIVEDYERR